MDFDGFVAAARAQWEHFDDDDALGRAPHPRDRRLAPLPDRIRGFATENKLMLLNLAVRHMEPGEVYVEVGTWRGLSAVGAAAGNRDRRLVVCDDFSKPGCTRAALASNLRIHCEPGQVDVRDCDYRDFLRRAPWRPARVGVYFYDGPHHFRHQVRALSMIRPFLADDALIVVDDTEDFPVRAANDLLERHVPGFQRVLDIRSPAYKHPHWWNGIQVFRWRADRAGREPEVNPIPRHAYLPRLLLWSRGVVYGQRLAHYAREGARRAVALVAPARTSAPRGDRPLAPPPFAQPGDRHAES